jgi:hypothetical protein
MLRQKFLEIIILPLIERGLYCNHLVRPLVRPSVRPCVRSSVRVSVRPSVSPFVRLSIRSHFRNRYLSFYWKKWLHIYFLFTVRLTNERVGVFLVRRSVQHLGFFYQNLRRAVLKMILVKYIIKWKKTKNTTCHDDRTFTFKKKFIVIVVDMSLSS